MEEHEIQNLLLKFIQKYPKATKEDKLIFIEGVKEGWFLAMKYSTKIVKANFNL